MAWNFSPDHCRQVFDPWRTGTDSDRAFYLPCVSEPQGFYFAPANENSMAGPDRWNEGVWNEGFWDGPPTNTPRRSMKIIKMPVAGMNPPNLFDYIKALLGRLVAADHAGNPRYRLQSSLFHCFYFS
jgi:hypothetical protein